MFLISLAYADAASSAAPNPLMQFIPIIAIFVVFYFFMIRPQSKKAQEHKDMLANIKKGETVLLNSGIIGRVKEIKEDHVSIEVGAGVSFFVLKNAIASLYTGDVKIFQSAEKKITTPQVQDKKTAKKNVQKPKKIVKKDDDNNISENI